VPPLRKFRITTGKAIEKYVVFPGLLLILLLIGSHNYQVLQMIVQH
jgi:hypothetical protein